MKTVGQVDLRATCHSKKWDFDLELNLEASWKTPKCDVKTQLIDIWPWPLTYNPSLAKAKIAPLRRFKREWWLTDGQTDIPTKHLPCFTVDNHQYVWKCSAPPLTCKYWDIDVRLTWNWWLDLSTTRWVKQFLKSFKPLQNTSHCCKKIIWQKLETIVALG